MARDAFEDPPVHPAWPRKPDGTPDENRMPTGTHLQRDVNGKVHVIDVTPRYRDGSPMTPPTIPGGTS